MFGLLMVLAVAGGTPEAGTATQQPPPITIVGERQKPVCKRRIATGSVIPKVVCTTAAQDQQLTERSIQLQQQIVQRMDADRETQVQRQLPK